MSSKGFVCGIDLGTSNSCCSVWKDNRVEVIPTLEGFRTIPSYVGFTENERLIGESAKNAAIMNPENTIFAVKRLIGRRFSDQPVKDLVRVLPYKVVERGDKPYVSVNYLNERKEFSPEEISSMILSKIKEYAEAFLNEKVSRCVITVPAYFNDTQRNATKDAARIAGFEVLRIINEPTAACLSYGLDKVTEKEMNILIFDLGAGTLDCTILSLDGGVFEVKSTSGNTCLGGTDIDTRISEYLLKEFEKQNKIQVSGSSRAIRRLRTAAEKAKITLSSNSQAPIEIDCFYEGKDFYTTLTRAKYEELCHDLFIKCLDPINQALLDAKLSKSQINEIVLVGGGSRIPKVQQLLRDFFNGKELNKSCNPDEVVSSGAALMGAILSGEKNEKLDALVLLDVCPLTLGVEVSGQFMEPLIDRNTTIPCRKSKTFSTACDNQPSVRIAIYEGERKMSKDNNLLGNFELSNIPPAPRGVPQIEISFDLDSNGILNVKAEDKASGNKNSITITNDSKRLSKEEIDRMVHEAEKYREQDSKVRDQFEARNGLENYCYSLKNSLKDLEGKLSSQDKETIEKSVQETLDWLSSHEKEGKEEYEKRKKEVEGVVFPIMTKVYQGTTQNPGMSSSGTTSSPRVEEVD